jgi:uncharacterized protein (DUF1800 family)
LNEVEELGFDFWFDQQLKAGEEDFALRAQLDRLEIHHLSPWDLRDWPMDRILAQLQQAALLRATYSPWQIRERMADFWTNHFNIYGRKGLGAYRKPLDERLVVRANVLGSFPAMVRASSKSAAMLVYLDQQNSTAAQPNENYARELLELHTLGVDGGYSQKDVMEVARCFTGWSEERRFLRAKGDFLFRPELHDDGQKVVLGQVIPAGGGVRDGERVVEILTKHPATARHISGKFCRFFAGDDWEKHLPVVIRAYEQSEGDIPTMVRSLKDSMASSPQSQPILKRPFDYLASSLRALNAETDGGEGIQHHLRAMGQPLYEWPMPDGYPVGTEPWTGSLLARWNFASALVRNEISGTQVDLEQLQKLFPDQRPISMALNQPSTQSQVQELDTLLSQLEMRDQVALSLASPEFQWR